MAIEGLLDSPRLVEHGPYLRGILNIADEAAVAVEALDALHILGDKYKALETVTSDFQDLADLGYSGRLFVQTTADQANFDRLLEVADSKRSDGIDITQRYPNLWVPGTESASYADYQLDDSPRIKAMARLVLFNANTDTCVDPILQHLNQPFDDYGKDKWGGDTTQLDEIDKDMQVFEAIHLGFKLSAVDHRDFAFMALMDRIKGVGPDDLILDAGYMRVPDLSRRTVEGGSIVGRVLSVYGQLTLSGSQGGVDPDGGVAVHIGLDTSEA